jgi:hypothetical protein
MVADEQILMAFDVALALMTGSRVFTLVNFVLILVNVLFILVNLVFILVNFVLGFLLSSCRF